MIATSRSGGVLPYYGLLKGDNYSIYIETSLGTAVMQYSDPSSATHPSREALSEPEPLRKDLPDGLRPTHVVFACILDRTGDLKDLRVLEPGAAETTSKILVALPKWKFRPAFRGNEPVEVTAIIGFRRLIRDRENLYRRDRRGRVDAVLIQRKRLGFVSGIALAMPKVLLRRPFRGWVSKTQYPLRLSTTASSGCPFR